MFELKRKSKNQLFSTGSPGLHVRVSGLGDRSISRAKMLSRIFFFSNRPLCFLLWSSNVSACKQDKLHWSHLNVLQCVFSCGLKKSRTVGQEHQSSEDVIKNLRLFQPTFVFSLVIV